MAPRRKFGDQDACSRCGHDVEWWGQKKGWVDRGSGNLCLPYRDRSGEVVHPPKGSRHTVRGNVKRQRALPRWFMR